MGFPLPFLLAAGVVGLYALASKGGQAGGGGGAATSPTIPPLPGEVPGEVPGQGRGGAAVPGQLPDNLQSALDAVMAELQQNPGPEAIQAATALAGRLESAGFGAIADQLRAAANAARAQLPPPPLDKQVPAPGLPPELVAKLNQAIATERDPEKLREILAALKANPASSDPQVQMAIQMLEALIAEVEAKQQEADTIEEVDDILKEKSPGQPQKEQEPHLTIQPVPSPVVPEPPAETKPVPPKPVPQPVPKPKSPQAQAAEALALHLLSLEKNHGFPKTAKGKEDKVLIKRFQKSENLKQDAKVGPGTMLAVAKYVGNLPHVWHWPKSATAADVEKYRAKLLAMAAQAAATGNQLRANQLQASAAHEHGEGGIVGPAPVPAPEPSVPSVPSVPSLPGPSPQPSAGNPLATQLAEHLSGLERSRGFPKTAKGKEDKVLIKRFQASEGLEQDGKVGPGTMLAVAKTVGNLPHVWHWPKSATATDVNRYRTKLVVLAQEADSKGQTTRAEQLRQSALREKGQGGIVGSAPKPIPNEKPAEPPPLPREPTPSPAPSPSPAPIEQPPTSPAGLAAAAMVANQNELQRRAGGNLSAVKGSENKSLVRKFQQLEGVSADGLTGPGTLALAGKYVGNLPLVMYWPKNANMSNVEKYRTALLALAEKADRSGDPVRAANLRASAAREQGQGGIAETGPVPARGSFSANV